MTGELAVWRAVIAVALQDAEYHGLQSGQRLDADRARQWLLHDKRDFVAVCDLAGVDARAVREDARRRASAGWPATHALRGLAA